MDKYNTYFLLWNTTMTTYILFRVSEDIFDYLWAAILTAVVAGLAIAVAKGKNEK
jgi:hypothetical protein